MQSRIAQLLEDVAFGRDLWRSYGKGMIGELERLTASDAATEDTAYAVLQGNELIFFRSREEYSSGQGKTVTDIEGNRYTGTVYTGVETSAYDSIVSVPWNRNYNIASVRFAQRVAPVSTAYWFYYCGNMTFADLRKLDTSHVTDMSGMFYNCGRIAALDLSGFDTSSVTDMQSMFRSCSSLTTLNVSGFDTSRVTNMSKMFDGVFRMTALDVSGLDTGSATDMSEMFYGCSALTALDLSGFDTGSATDMGRMLEGCGSLSRVTLGESFRFRGANIGEADKQALLPYPEGDPEEYTGRWTREYRYYPSYTPEELRDAYDGSADMVGAWVWEQRY